MVKGVVSQEPKGIKSKIEAVEALKIYLIAAVSSFPDPFLDCSSVASNQSGSFCRTDLKTLHPRSMGL